MKPRRPSHTAPARIDAFRGAASTALIVTAVLLVLVKMLTGIMMVAAVVFGLMVFLFVFAMKLRMTPYREDQ